MVSGFGLHGLAIAVLERFVNLVVKINPVCHEYNIVILNFVFERDIRKTD
jgi:hypothetical protein